MESYSPSAAATPKLKTMCISLVVTFIGGKLFIEEFRRVACFMRDTADQLKGKSTRLLRYLGSDRNCVDLFLSFVLAISILVHLVATASPTVAQKVPLLTLIECIVIACKVQ